MPPSARALDDQAEAMTMADRIVVMDRGLVQQVGPPLTVYGDPANRFVAGFFGVPAMNFLDGAVEVHGDAIRFKAAGVTLDPGRRERTSAAAVTLGVRPEHVRLAPDGEGWPAAVSLIEPMGDETLVFLDYGGPASIVAKVDAEEKVAVGDQRRFTFRIDRVVFFDGASDARILR
jgi:ABC-type sugar transport system ATPase subunit